jgi:hypothetical protein
MVNVVGILTAFVMLLVFYMSGVGLKSILNIKSDNPLSSIIFGFFTYFAYITVTTLPFLFFNIIAKSYLYVIFGLTLIYFAFAIILVRNWLTTELFSMKTVQFIVALIFISVIVSVVQEKISPNMFISKDSRYGATIFSTLNNTNLNIWGGRSLSFIRDNQMNEQSIFHMFQYMICLVFKDVKRISYFIKPFWFVVSSFLWTALYVEMYSLLSKERRQWQRWSIFVGGLVVFLGLFILVMRMGITSLTNDSYFVLLIIFVCTIVIKHVGARFPQYNMPVVIGISMGSYMAFSSENTYPVLFLIYAFVFLMQLRLKIGYFRDIAKISALVLIEFIIYNILMKLWIQTGIFAAIFVIVLFISFRANSRYFLETKLELYLQQRNIFAILLLPVAFFVISIAYSLANELPIVAKNSDYLQIILWWLDPITNDSVKGWTVFLVIMIFVGLSIAWIFLRQRVTKNFVYSAVDIFFILYLTFYNPFFTKIIEAIGSSITKTAGYSLIGVAFVIVAMLPIQLANFVSDKNKNRQLIIYKRPSRLII